MRTFHTGGVAGADITHGLPRVVELFEARKPKGLAKIAEQDGVVVDRGDRQGSSPSSSPTTPARSTATRSRAARACSSSDGEKVEAGTQLNEGSLYPHELLALRGRTETEQYLVKEVQEVYKSQGVDINDKHIELIVRQMLKKVRVDQKGDTGYLPGPVRRPLRVRRRSTPTIKKAKGETAQFEEIILGITKASLNTDSFLSAASFQETTKVLTDAALEGKKDTLNGLKENVIIGKLIPAATGLKRYRRIEIEPAEPLPRAMDEVGLLDQDEIAAELGLGDGDGLGGFGAALRRGPRRSSRTSAPAGRTPASPTSSPSSTCPPRTDRLDVRRCSRGAPLRRPAVPPARSSTARQPKELLASLRRVGAFSSLRRKTTDSASDGRRRGEFRPARGDE